MDGAYKLQRKATLSLSTRLNHKRLGASPQNRLKTSTSNSARDLSTSCETLQRSPSVISICSDGGIECTPPHKKINANLDDSQEYSPTCLLSQTLAIDSPEVGWKWSRHSVNDDSEQKRAIEDNSNRTPDSAYAADSSFASAGSCSTEAAGNTRSRSNSYHQRIVYHTHREDHRKLLEQEMRRVKKTRVEEKLKERCEKLQEQLRSAGTQNSKTKIKSNKDNISRITSDNSSTNDVEIKYQQTTNICTAGATVKFQTPEKLKNPQLLNDFFNDTDSDSFLLEATQEIESKLDAKTQPAFINVANTTPKSSISSEFSSIPHANTAPATTTPSALPTNKTVIHKIDLSTNGENKEKRSSFYMKFLEDDCSDDWFVSLDEVILQATQNKKPRTSLQRYKSMPAETATNLAVSFNEKDSNDNCIAVDANTSSSKRLIAISDDTAGSSSSKFSKIKRHSSTHTLSPASGSYRSRRQL